MTKMIATLIALAVTVNASAFPIFCKGNGYGVSVNANGTKAQVYDKNNQPLMFGKLNCLTTFTMEVRPEGSPLVLCNTAQHVADAGLKVYVFKPHHTNDYVGTLTTQSFAGPRKLADLKCVVALHNN